MSAFNHYFKTVLARLPRLGRLPLPPLPIFLGAALALGGCSEGGGSSVQPMIVGEADELYIQPIRVCDDFGNACARVNLFADITAKILAQAQLKISFLPINQLNNSRFLSIDGQNAISTGSEFYEMTRRGGACAFGRHPSSTDSSGPINLWFVDEIVAASGFVEFGLAWVEANGVVISGATLDFNGGNGRTDTVAHEIGHNLGLRHATLGAGGASNLMTEGDRRLIPRSADDVGVDGAGLSLLTDAQKKKIQTSSFLNRTASSAANCTVSPDQAGAIADPVTLALSSSDAGPITPFILEASHLSPSSDSRAPTSVPEPTMRWISLLAAGFFLLSLNRQPHPVNPS
ncbi:MAG: zinc-dependent metalloprotease family protein [Phormidesmis sp.]